MMAVKLLLAIFFLDEWARYKKAPAEHICGG